MYSISNLNIMITSTETIFDTRVDTKKMFVSIRYNFTPRKPANKKGEALLYLHVTGRSERARINTDVRIPMINWNKTTQRVNGETPEVRDLNLILDNLQSKITSIKTTYRLSNKVLDVAAFEEEFLRGIPRIDFISFIEHHLKSERSEFAKGTIIKHESFIRNLKRFKKQIFFPTIDHQLIQKFKTWMYEKNNSRSTISSNMARFKKYMSAAKRHGILLAIDPKEIKVSKMESNKIDLNENEIKTLISFYKSNFIKPSHSLVLGYFLFSCFNGNRIGEVLSINREQFTGDFFKYYEEKNDKNQRMKINNATKMILNQNKSLFIKKFSEQYTNNLLKEICVFCGIKKKISFHNSRHTFATNFIRMGGDPASLQLLLNHSTIKQSMEYVHIVKAEANEKVFIMDNLLN